MRTFTLYALTGVLSALVYGFVLWGATSVWNKGLFAILLAQFLALVFHLIVNAKLTFGGVKITGPLVARYVVFQLGINITMAFISSFLLNDWAVHPLLAGIISTGIVGVFTFFIARLWVFRA